MFSGDIAVSYPEVFSYRWIGVAAQILSPNILEKDL